MNLALGEVDGSRGPDLQRVYPGIVGLGGRQRRVLAEFANGRSILENGDTIRAERDLLAIFGRDFSVDVELAATIRTDMEVVDALD